MTSSVNAVKRKSDGIYGIFGVTVSLKCHPSSLPYPPEEGRGRERLSFPFLLARAPPLGGKEERTDDILD